MSDVDTSAEAVGRLAATFDDAARTSELAATAGPADITAEAMRMAERNAMIAATLRALVAERDAAIQNSNWWKAEAQAALADIAAALRALAETPS